MGRPRALIYLKRVNHAAVKPGQSETISHVAAGLSAGLARCDDAWSFQRGPVDKTAIGAYRDRAGTILEAMPNLFHTSRYFPRHDFANLPSAAGRG